MLNRLTGPFNALAFALLGGWLSYGQVSNLLQVAGNLSDITCPFLAADLVAAIQPLS
jgi:hypothetical protein